MNLCACRRNSGEGIFPGCIRLRKACGPVYTQPFQPAESTEAVLLKKTPSSGDCWSDCDDTRLLSAVADGDTQAFRALYMRHYGRLERFIVRMSRRTDLVEEILNDTFFTVWRKAGGFHADSRVSTWIYGICYRKCLKALERSERWGARHCSGSEYEAAWSEQERPDEQASRDQLQRRLRRELHSLPPEQRMVFELTYFMGYSYPEIAEVANCPVNTIKTRMFHARRKLRKSMSSLAGAGAR